MFVDNAEGEGADLNNIDLAAAQNQLISGVAAANPNTVVVVNTGSAVTMPWANSVKGVIENWYPGQEDGNAIAALLYGDANFSGKLPVTFPQSLADVPAAPRRSGPGQNGTVQYSEGARRRLPLVRRAEQDADVPVRLRPVLHHLRLRQPDRRRPATPPATSRSAST